MEEAREGVRTAFRVTKGTSERRRAWKKNGGEGSSVAAHN